MTRERIHFVTGRLAAPALEQTLAALAPQAEFDYSVQTLPITVAALMTVDWVASRITAPEETSRVILPGFCLGNIDSLGTQLGVAVERGPKDLRELPATFGIGAKGARPEDYGKYDLEIIAEINHAPQLSLEVILAEAEKLAEDGANVIDVGCDPGETWQDVGPVVRELCAAGHRVSIDSFNPKEVEAAVTAGAELVLSVDKTNLHLAADWGCEVVLIPDKVGTLDGLDESIEKLTAAGVPFRIDPIIEPIGFGFAASLGRYLEVRRRYPEVEIMMGIGNLTELTDVDSAGVNVLLLGFCQELGIRSVLTTEVINWARSSVAECDLARRLMYHAVTNKTLPKHVEPNLVMLRDAVLHEHGPEELARLAAEIKDRNYRLFAEGGKLHALAERTQWSDEDPFVLFEKMSGDASKPIEADHAFYLGYEMAKAAMALQLGKQYRQDQALDWGLLTQEEVSHRERRRRGERVVGGYALMVDGESQKANAAFEPLVERLDPGLDACDAFQRLIDLPHIVYFDSARRDASLGRYSFVAADPFEYLEQPLQGNGALAVLKAKLEQFPARRMAGLPPFQGGAAGLLSYDLGRQLEVLPTPKWDEFNSPALAMGLYDVVLAFDHVEEESWIISHGLPETSPGKRRDRAARRLQEFRERLKRSTPTISKKVATNDPSPLPSARLAPQFAVGEVPNLTSNFSREGYLQSVERAIEYIYAGDIFQVNLAQRLLYPAAGDSVGLYLRLRERNPATFAGYFDLGGRQLASASPERFLRVSDGQVEARPIKGTRGRATSPEADLFAGDDLQASEKDRAENVMIVDLLRNDLSRVCQTESVYVADLCRLETYEFVQHLVSEIRGTLKPGVTPIELLRGDCAGRIDYGAPKIRAMEIIAELEQVARGAYCGSLGYLGFDGSMDTSILIRTFTCGRGWWQAPVGGGIVAQSVPRLEYEETWHKAEGLLRALK